MKSDTLRAPRSIPPIVHIVITQATLRRAQGEITEEKFAAQILRLAREELEPKGLSLLTRELGNGRRRFLVKDTATGTVRDMLDFAPDGTPESEASQVSSQAHATH